MRYRLVSGSVWGRGGSLPIGSIVDLSDEKAAVWRAGGCVLEQVEAHEPVAAAPVAPAPEVDPQASASPKPRRNSRKRTPSPEGA